MTKAWLSLAGIMAGLACAAAMAAPLQLGTDEWAPYETLNDSQAPGFSVEVVRRVFDGMGRQVEIHQYPWARAQNMVYSGQNDGLFTAFRNAERMEHCYYPDEPLAVDRWVLFVRKDNLNRLAFHSLTDLNGRTVGVVRGAAVTPEFWSVVKGLRNYEEAVDDDEDFRKLLAGRIDYVVASFANGMLERYRLQNGGLIVPLPGAVLKEDAMYLIFSKRTVSPDLVNAFSKELHQFKQTAEYRAIFRRYFPGAGDGTVK